MATELAPKPSGHEPGELGPAGPAAVPDRGIVDLTELQAEADLEAAEVAELLEVELPRSVGVERISTRMVVTGVAVMLVVVLAPLLVLLATLALPTTEQVQGAVLVAGWVALAAGARWIEVRRTPPRGGKYP